MSQPAELPQAKPLFDLLTKLAEGILRHQVPPEILPHYAGGLLCPRCGMVHLRSSEACFPLAFMYRRTGNRLYFDAFRHLGRYALRTQGKTGWWNEETTSTSRSTTVFTLFSLLNAYKLLEKDLMTSSIGMEYLLAVRRAAGWVSLNVTESTADTEMLSCSLPTLELAGSVLEEPAFTRQARRNAEALLARFDSGFITAGGKRYPPETPHPPVDVAANSDAALAFVALYLRLLATPFEELASAFRQAAETHLNFFYPDGSVDGSWGCRSYRWSVHGSKGAIGSHPWTWLMAADDGRFTRAALLNTGLMQGMIFDHLLANAAHCKRTGRSPCIQSTWDRAGSLANALRLDIRAVQPEAPLPLEVPGFKRFFPLVNVVLARTAHLALTISGYGHTENDDIIEPCQPMGGAVSYLWHDKWGAVQVGSQGFYKRFEPAIMPEADGDAPSSTPRLRLLSEAAEYSNAWDPYCEIRDEGNVVTAAGSFRTITRRAADANYRIRYTLGDSFIEKHYEITHMRKNDTLEILEPVVVPENLALRVLDDGQAVSFKTQNAQVLLSVRDGKVSLSDTVPTCMPFPCFFNVQPRITPKHHGEKSAVTVRIEIS